MKNNELEKFYSDRRKNIKKLSEDDSIKELGNDFLTRSALFNYSYNFSWMGRPIIAYPQDMIAMQEIIWNLKPDLIIETGIAHGGSLIYYASLLELIGLNGTVLGIDVDIRSHNRKLIEEHPMYKRIKMIEGDSTSQETYQKVLDVAKNKRNVLICLDSNHTHNHVLKELNLYANLTAIGSYCVVFDTCIEFMPKDYDWKDKWGIGNNPKTAVDEFLKLNHNFIIDEEIDSKLSITVAPGGYLKRVK